MRKPRSEKPKYTWLGNFTKNPAARHVAGDVWSVKGYLEKKLAFVNVATGTCTICVANCDHLTMARAQRRYIIRRGLAIHKGRDIIIPDADMLAIGEIMQAYRASVRARSKGGAHD